MTAIKAVTFDIEIKNCIQGKGELVDSKYEYCGGWNDQAGMGISVLCAYFGWLREYRFYDESNILKFIEDIKPATLVHGYNIFGFDIPVLKATLTRLGHDEETGMKGKCYDSFGDIKKALNNGYPKGWTLDAVAEATLNFKKTADGSAAPRMFQDGRTAELYTYVTQDVRIEHTLLNHIIQSKPVTIEGGPSVVLSGIEKFL